MKNAFFTLAMALGMGVTAYLGGIGVRVVIDSGYYDMRLLAVDIVGAVVFWAALMVDDWFAKKKKPVIGWDIAAPGSDRSCVVLMRASSPIAAGDVFSPSPTWQATKDATRIIVYAGGGRGGGGGGAININPNASGSNGNQL